MFFILALILVTAALAICGAYFSIYGLMQLFSGAPISIAVMGSSLEAGKLIAASFLYRMWDKCNFLLKTYLIVAVMTLMAITSAGIFGYLSAAYQQESVGLNDTKQQMVLLSEEQIKLEERLKGINLQIEGIPKSYVSKRMQLIATFKQEKDAIVKRLDEISKEKKELTSNQIIKSAKVGPIVFIAEALGKTPDFAITILVTILTLVFDPLAIALTLATNIAIKSYFEDKEKAKKNHIIEPVSSEPQFINAGFEVTPEDLKDEDIDVKFSNLKTHIPNTNPEPFPSVPVETQEPTITETVPEPTPEPTQELQHTSKEKNILEELAQLKNRLDDLSNKDELSKEEIEEKNRATKRIALLQYIGSQQK